MSILRHIDQIEEPAVKLRRQMAKGRLKSKYTLNNIITANEAVINLKRIAEIYAESQSTILITGESGTGKELFAQSIHNLSERKNMPFVALNCAALAESLLEAELFGYAEASFTGARKGGRQGLFQLAHNGTIFLDEIGEMPITFQSKLLRVLQERQVRPVGGDDIIPVNVRVIAATNRDLRREIQEGRFRLDLFYRLNVLTLDIPPLRDRKDDLPALTKSFFFRRGQAEVWERHQKEIGQLLAELADYDFPGNVRELENILEMVNLLLKKGVWGDKFKMNFPPLRTAGQVPAARPMNWPGANSFADEDAADERARLTGLMQKHRGDKKKVAREMGYSLPTLYRHLKKLEPNI